MKTHVAEAVRHLIDRFGLHEDVTGPVPIFNLEPMFPVVHRDLDTMGVAGLVILPKAMPITETNFAQVVLNTHLGPDEARLVYAHEVGHAVSGHEGELRCASLDSWFADRAERQAWHVAARLLIPDTAWQDRRDVQRMAATFRVPPALVAMAMR